MKAEIPIEQIEESLDWEMESELKPREVKTISVTLKNSGRGEPIEGIMA